MANGISGSVFDESTSSWRDIEAAWVWGVHPVNGGPAAWNPLVSSWVYDESTTSWKKWYDPLVLVEEIYEHTGELQTFVVPSVSTLYCRLWGCAGKNGTSNEKGGYGGYSDIEINVGGVNEVQVGDTLHIVVGGQNTLQNSRPYGGGGREPKGGGGMCALFTSDSGLSGTYYPTYSQVPTSGVPIGTPLSMYNACIAVCGGGGGAGDRHSFPRGGNGNGDGSGSGSNQNTNWNASGSGSARGGTNTAGGSGTGTAAQSGRLFHGAGNGVADSSSHGGGAGYYGGGGGEYGSGGGAGIINPRSFVGISGTGQVQYLGNTKMASDGIGGHQNDRGMPGNESGLVVIRTSSFIDV